MSSAWLMDSDDSADSVDSDDGSALPNTSVSAEEAIALLEAQITQEQIAHAPQFLEEVVTAGTNASMSEHRFLTEHLPSSRYQSSQAPRPDIPALPLSYLQAFLCAPENAKGERPCARGNECVGKAELTGIRTPFVLKEFLLPTELTRAHADQEGGRLALPPVVQLCVLCQIAVMTRDWITAHTLRNTNTKTSFQQHWSVITETVDGVPKECTIFGKNEVFSGIQPVPLLRRGGFDFFVKEGLPCLFPRCWHPPDRPHDTHADPLFH